MIEDGDVTSVPAPTVEPLPRGRGAAALATLDPGYFALVMATGIVAIGARLLGHEVVAIILLWLTITAFVALVVLYLARAIAFPRRFAASLLDPGQAVSYFTVVAGFTVLATALAGHRFWVASFVLGVVAFVVWLALTYGLFCLVVLAGHRPVLREINGAWLIWVVSTQSVSVLGSELAPQLPWPFVQDVFGTAALLFWSVGIVLYIILVVIIFLRLFLIPTTPAELGPAYWILMGATAISVRAAAGLLGRSPGLPEPVMEEVRGFVAGFSIVLWAFGSWFIPMLVLFGLWRHLVRRYPGNYEPTLWSVVFPLGMYAVASVTLGRVIDFPFLRDLATVWVWIAIAAWLIVAALGVIAAVRWGRGKQAEVT